MKRVLILLVCMGVILLTGCHKKNEMSVEEIYREVLSQYLLETLELERYDQELVNSDMKYIPNEGEDIKQAQKEDKMFLKYIYLRNELHIERLSDEDVNILLEEAKKGNLYSDKARKVVINSFAYVIASKEIKSEADKKVETTYDSYLVQDFVTVDSLVFVIGTESEFDEEGNFVDYSHEEKKIEELEKFSKQMEKELEGKLDDVPIRVLFER